MTCLKLCSVTIFKQRAHTCVSQAHPNPNPSFTSTSASHPHPHSQPLWPRPRPLCVISSKEISHNKCKCNQSRALFVQTNADSRTDIHDQHRRRRRRGHGRRPVIMIMIMPHRISFQELVGGTGAAAATTFSWLPYNCPSDFRCIWPAQPIKMVEMPPPPAWKRLLCLPLWCEIPSKSVHNQLKMFHLLTQNGSFAVKLIISIKFLLISFLFYYFMFINPLSIFKFCRFNKNALVAYYIFLYSAI